MNEANREATGGTKGVFINPLRTLITKYYLSGVTGVPACDGQARRPASPLFLKREFGLKAKSYKTNEAISLKNVEKQQNE